MYGGLEVSRGRRLRWPLAMLGAAGVLLAGCGAHLRAARVTPEQHLAAARQALDRKRCARARTLARRVLRWHPTSPLVVDAWLVVADSYIEQRNWPRASEECKRLLDAHPRTAHYTAVLRREFQIGEALAASRVWLLFFTARRTDEGVRVLERVIERAPTGPLADRAVYAIGEAYFRDGDYARARTAYDRLLKQYPNSELIVRARVRRATANQRLAGGPAYDHEPAQAARRDMEDLARMSGSERVARYARDLRDVTARGDYDSGLFYFGRYSIDGGVRYLKAIIARYPDSEYADRAERLLALLRRLTSEAASEEAP